MPTLRVKVVSLSSTNGRLPMYSSGRIVSGAPLTLRITSAGCCACTSQERTTFSPLKMLSRSTRNSTFGRTGSTVTRASAAAVNHCGRRRVRKVSALSVYATSSSGLSATLPSGPSTLPTSGSMRREANGEARQLKVTL